MAGDLDVVRRYIALNQLAIMDYWYEHIDGVELVRSLVRLSPQFRQAALQTPRTSQFVHPELFSPF